jgi:protein-disulfide isomerase
MPHQSDAQDEPRASHGAISDFPMSTNKTLRLAALAAAIVICAALLNLEAAVSNAAGGLTDAQLITYLKKRYRIPEDRNITLGPPVKTPFAKLRSRTVTVIDQHGGAFKAGTIFTQPDVNDLIMGELIDLGSDPWGRVDMNEMHLADRPTMGPADAPITIVEFADFECPHCAHAMGVVETAVESKYSGKVRLIFKNFPLQGHLWARAAAIASECVLLQNPAVFWDFARDIYRNQALITPDNLGQQIDDFARHNQLDVDSLHACEMGQSADQMVAQDITDGENAHVVSTPTLFVDGIPVLGAEPDVLDSVINSELAKKAG